MSRTLGRPLWGALTLALLSGCNWELLDPNDCDVSRDCHFYHPENLLCGLTHASWDGHPGANCAGLDPTYDKDGAWGCPDGFSVARIGDHDSGNIAELNTCAAIGNAESSSAELAEVPFGAACGLNSSGSGGTDHPCEGVNPLTGSCPDGFVLRYTFDVYFDAETEGASPRMGAHVDTWCEMGETGCHGDACPDPVDIVCGLHGNAGWYAAGSIPFRNVPAGELTPELYAFIEADLADGEELPGQCQGLPQDECPDGMERVCVDDGTGSDTHSYAEDAWCWCAAEGTTRSRTDDR